MSNDIQICNQRGNGVRLYTEVLVNPCRSRARGILRRFYWPRIMHWRERTRFIIFYAKIKVSAFVNFEVDRLKKKKMMMMISPTLRVLPCIETLVEQAVCLKRLRTAVFESSESLFLLRLNRRVGTIPTYRESTDSLVILNLHISMNTPNIWCYPNTLLLIAYLVFLNLYSSLQ